MRLEAEENISSRNRQDRTQHICGSVRATTRHRAASALRAEAARGSGLPGARTGGCPLLAPRARNRIDYEAVRGEGRSSRCIGKCERKLFVSSSSILGEIVALRTLHRRRLKATDEGKSKRRKREGKHCGQSTIEFGSREDISQTLAFTRIALFLGYVNEKF